MCKTCVKCGQEMISDEGVISCPQCVSEVMIIKRSLVEDAGWYKANGGEDIGSKESKMFGLREE